MKTLVTIVLTLASILEAGAQKLNFARTIDFPGFSPAITHDRYGRSYVCVSTVYGGMATIGYLLVGYDQAGNEILRKSWDQKFWITDLKYDGQNHFFACGTFTGQTDIDGIQVQSKGMEDCFVAKLDLQGKAVWVRTFGSAGTETSGRLAFDETSQKLLCTGSCQSDLYMGSQFLETAVDRSSYVMAFGADGSLISHSVHHFPGNTGLNSGLEVTNSNNSFFLLHQRAGRSWADETSSLPEEGIYLAKLDQDLKMTWSTMIINGGCYYGYSCGRIAQNNSGQCFVPSYCHYKYGGAGLLAGYDLTGAVTWSCNNNDGSYADTYSTGENLYFLGTEGANGCPCESNNPGYQVIKKANSSGILDYEYKFPDARMRRITASKDGIVTVFGLFYEPTFTIFGTTLVNPNPGSATSFLFSYCENDCQQQMPTTAVNEESIERMELFPNPASGSIKLQANLGSDIALVKFVSVSGQVVKEKAVRSNSGRLDVSLEISDLPAGIYLVELSDAVSVRRTTLIRE